mmetsp:Transcript_16649/g.34850  ORF Transcript_16649/g.34850 Transcript_16649/m.34850 type:complete len:83 (+) Transcript_16649:600-848(+)
MKFIQQDEGRVVGRTTGVDSGVLAAFGYVSLDEESSKQLDQFLLVQYPGTEEVEAFEEFGVWSTFSIHGLFVGEEIFAVKVS